MAQPQQKPVATAKKPTKKKKKKRVWGKVILSVLMVVLILAASTFIYYLGRTVYVSYLKGDDEGGTTEVDPIVYETTPVSHSEKVGYYLLGLMGDEGAEDATDMLTLACFDKEAKTLRMMYIPAATYLGDDSAFKVKRVADVFPNPQDYVWCTTCRGRVYEPEVGKDNVHTVCGKELTTKEGSSTVNLVEVINRQYGLPVDGFFIFEQQTFVKLIDLIGGVDVNLAFDVTIEDTTYKKGPRAIDGQAALKYITAADGKIKSDIARYTRFQQVFTAAMQRLFAMDEDKLAADVFQPLMVGSTPIRLSVNDSYRTVVPLVKQLAEVPFEQMSAFVLPGEETSSDGTAYYSVHRQDLLTFLNKEFNPYGDKLTEGDLNVTELAAGKKSDLTESVLSQWVMEQTGVATTTDPAEDANTTEA
ncbi:MAG: LCP family protein [Clostridia bacterium]|nr:LCP family protein [Clostridia bacterium]